MPNEKVYFSIDLNHLTASIGGAILSTVDDVAYGLQLISSSEVKSLELPDSRLQLLWPEGHKYDINDVKSRFTSSVLGNGLVDFLESFNFILDDIRKICSIYSLGKAPTLKGSDIEKLLEKDSNFIRWTTSRKLIWLKDTYGFSVPRDVYECILSIDSARNCLVHRKGKVSLDEDVKPSGRVDSLLIKWLRYGFYDKDKNFFSIGDILQGGVKYNEGFKEVSKEFKVNEVINFTAEEFAEIGLTLMKFGSHLVEAINKYGIDKGAI